MNNISISVNNDNSLDIITAPIVVDVSPNISLDITEELDSSVSISSDSNIIVNAEPILVQIVDPATIGPRGPRGPAGEGVTTEYVAGEAIGGHRVVRGHEGKAFYASNVEISHATTILGITTSSATIDSLIPVQSSNILEEPSWNWSEGFIWLGENGLLTQTPPTSPSKFSLIVARAISATEIIIQIGVPIFL